MKGVVGDVGFGGHLVLPFESVSVSTRSFDIVVGIIVRVLHVVKISISHFSSDLIDSLTVVLSSAISSLLTLLFEFFTIGHFII